MDEERLIDQYLDECGEKQQQPGENQRTSFNEHIQSHAEPAESVDQQQPALNKLSINLNQDDPDITYSQEINDSIKKSAMEFSFVSRYTTVQLDRSDIQTLKQNKRLFGKTYNEPINDKLLTQVPLKQDIQNFLKNVIITTKMEKEIPIVALVYVERLIVSSGFGLTGRNWRRITFTALVLASKIWDDESFENDNFSKAFPIYSTREINEMERVFLQFIGYNIKVKGCEYAKYYFLMRAFADKSKKSYPLRPLDIKTIIYLQRNSNRAERRLREIYALPFNKSF